MIFTDNLQMIFPVFFLSSFLSVFLSFRSWQANKSLLSVMVDNFLKSRKPAAEKNVSEEEREEHEELKQDFFFF